MPKRTMKIVIPTYRRTERQWTLRCIPKKWRKNVTLVCDRQDYLALRNGHDVSLAVVPDHVKTIAQKRKWILHFFKKADSILMLDDDLRFSRRLFSNKHRRPYTFKLIKATDKDVDWALLKVQKMLRKHAHVGIGPRQGNNSIQRHRRWNPNYRMVYALGYQPATVLKHCELGRIETREDMDLCLQLLTKGFENRVLVEVCADQTYGSKGGCTEERSIKRSNRDAKRLAQWFPSFVKVVKRDYKESIPRKEVVVSWKKAAAYGQSIKKSSRTKGGGAARK